MQNQSSFMCSWHIERSVLWAARDNDCVHTYRKTNIVNQCGIVFTGKPATLLEGLTRLFCVSSIFSTIWR